MQQETMNWAVPIVLSIVIWLWIFAMIAIGGAA